MATTQRHEPASDVERDAKDAPHRVADTVTGAASTAASTVAGVANDAMTRLPEAAATTREALSEAGRTITAGSDEQLSAGTLVAVGFALGMLVGGANRLLVLLALVPAAAMGLTLLERQSTTPGTRASSPSSSR